MSMMRVLTDAVAAAGLRVSDGSDAIAAVGGSTAALPGATSPLETALALALARFSAAWSDECGALAHETRTLGDGIGVAAAAYRESEWARAERTDALTLQLLGSPPGTPGTPAPGSGSGGGS